LWYEQTLSIPVNCQSHFLLKEMMVQEVESRTTDTRVP